MAKIAREKWKTLKHVFDLFTEQTLFKLISQGHFEGLESPIEMGKEANIFTARTSSGDLVIVKIYRLSTCDFKKMYGYLRTDPRFPALNKNRRKVVFAWAKREYRNLLKAREVGVRVPTPITQQNNVLVLECIGDEKPAPKLKDSIPSNPKKFLEEIVKNMRLLYAAGLVHADLSAFNILNHNNKPVFIDLSQATTLKDPNVAEYFERDIRNIARHFRKLGVGAEEEKIKKQITKT